MLREVSPIRSVHVDHDPGFSVPNLEDGRDPGCVLFITVASTGAGTYEVDPVLCVTIGLGAHDEFRDLDCEVLRLAFAVGHDLQIIATTSGKRLFLLERLFLPQFWTPDYMADKVYIENLEQRILR
jgi:hypothetical protein